MTRTIPLLRRLRYLARRGQSLANCLHCRRLVFACTRSGRVRLMEPGARVALTFYLGIGPEGMAELGDHRFAGGDRVLATPDAIVADDPRPHFCCHWRDRPMRVATPLPRPAIHPGQGGPR